MFAAKTQKIAHSFEQCAHEITNLITDYESHLLLEKLKLCLTSDFLLHFERKTKEKAVEEEDDKVVVVDPKVEIIQNFFKRLTCIKIIGSGRLAYKISVSLFSLLNSLELQNISLDSIQDLDSLRSQIKSLVLTRCSNISNVLQPDAWPLLKYLYLCNVGLTTIQPNLLPKSLKHLDLSWNSLSSFNFTHLTHISTLDLSFNKLRTIPKIDSNDIIITSLNSLYLRGNLIENLQGLQVLKSLVELDVSSNCIWCKTDLLIVLSSCECLENILLSSNPVTCDKALQSAIIKALPRLKTYDNKIISPSNIAKQQSKSLEVLKMEATLTSVERETNVSVIEEPNILFDDSQPLFCGSGEISTKAKKKKRQKRIAVIVDRSKEETSRSSDKQLISEESKDIKAKLEETKNVLKERKQSLGNEWLITVNQDAKPPQTPPSTPIDISSHLSPINNLKLNLSPTLGAHSEQNDVDKNETAAKRYEDDIEILNEEKADTSDLMWTQDDAEDDSNMFLVEKSLSYDKNETLFLSVKEGIITEKHCLTGKNLNTFDLKVLSTAEHLNENPIAIKLTFDSRILSKQAVIYSFENEDALREFKETFLLPCILRRKQEIFSKRKFYECLKCGLNKFSEETMDKCPKCKSDAFMELEHHIRDNRRSESDITVLSQFNSSSIPPAQPSSKVEEPTKVADVWEELCGGQEEYSESDFCTVDHELKLFLDVKILDDGEEIQCIFKCNIVCNKNEELLDALLVITNEKVYLLSKNDNQPNEDPIFAKPLWFLRFFKPLSHQGLWVEWTEDLQNEKNKKKKKSKGRINNVIMFFDDQKVFKIFEQHLSKINIALEIDEDDEEENEESTDTFIMSANIVDTGAPLFVSKTESGLLLLCKAEVKRNDVSFKALEEQMINDIVAPIYVTEDFKTATIDFHNEVNNMNSHWVIKTNSVNCMYTILSDVKKYWEESFAIPLHFYKVQDAIL
ncbi:serine/threonine-protein kinase 11-interacting protein-like isoform X1 [Dinothrombium tinctorium]|uniref:Serine/threonine-protein kinase 11-interacting protein-like isoform X1 n=1 Tax=Dinothrombium tinctorium TaxID=1965070 RepID=A0A3S3QT10_9ACAR|nr:serine/threonine-protein kinase 11-interacting protein-like isoform X1 [Dinothrombium tinctorium]